MQIFDYVASDRASAHPREFYAGAFCENDTAPSPVQLQITEDTLPQEGRAESRPCMSPCVLVFRGKVSS